MTTTDDERDIKYSRIIIERAVKLADGVSRTGPEVMTACGLSVKWWPDFIHQLRQNPWLYVKCEKGRYTFEIDYELLNLCERRQGPQPDTAGIVVFIKKLAREIHRRRKENHEKTRAMKWNPENVNKVEQKQILDHVEAELAKLILTINPPEADHASASQAQQNPQGEKEDTNGLPQRNDSDRTIDARVC